MKIYYSNISLEQRLLLIIEIVKKNKLLELRGRPYFFFKFRCVL